MKCISILLIVLIALAAVNTKVHRRHKSHKSHSRHHTKLATNLANFGEGILLVLTGASTALSKCMPAQWGAPQPALEGASNSMISGTGSIFKTIRDVLSKGISLACKVKGTIISWLSSKTRRRANRRRFFMQMKSYKARKALMKGFFGSVWNAAKSVGSSIASGVSDVGSAIGSAASNVGSAIATGAKNIGSAALSDLSKVGNSIVSGAKAVGGAVVNGVKAAGSMLMNGAASIFNGVVGSIKSIYNFFTSFFKSDLFSQIVKFIMCIKNEYATNPAIAAAITKFSGAFESIKSGWRGFVITFINIVCNWGPFKTAVDYVIQGVQSAAQALKWSNFGKFVGQIIRAVGDANGRRRH
jgi:phage-related protein